MGKKNIISEKKIDLDNLCEKYKVDKLYVFGSALTDRFSDKSDIDFIVSFKENVPILQVADYYFDLKDALGNLFEREIDLVTEDSVCNPFFAQEVENTKKYIYG